MCIDDERETEEELKKLSQKMIISETEWNSNRRKVRANIRRNRSTVSNIISEQRP